MEETKVAGPKTSNEYASRNGGPEKNIINLKEGTKRYIERLYGYSLAEVYAEEEYPKRLKIAALSPEIKKTLEELNELSRRLNEYEYSRVT